MVSGPLNNLRPIEFSVQTPCDDEAITERMAHRDALKYPDATPHRTCIIVSSGPSARDERLWSRIQDERPVTLALNGALELFMQRGLSPTYWACCDPQELVGDFIPPGEPWATVYLLATKCPESLFERLKHRNVETWRLDELGAPADKLRVPCAVSITLVAQSLMRYRGFTRFEHYGWDCCYVDGEHHASRQPEPTAEQMPFAIQTEDGTELYRCDLNGSWLAELRDAGLQAYNLTVMGHEIVVHGSHAVAQLLRVKGLAVTPDIP